MFFTVRTILLTLFFTCACGSLELVNDNELLNLITSENQLVVLFTKKDCEICDNYENELVSLREDIVDAVGALVVKVIGSQMLRLYSPATEPALVFFRSGIPLLYDGPLNDELILHTITNNREPISKELTDETFEHLTQAASGATTGDWFVMFYSTECVDCSRLQARWEAVGAQLKTRLNLARVNRGTTGAITARRFDVREVPSFILFKQGKLYRYQIKKYDIPSFVSFAQEWHKNVKGEKVPLQKAPFDDFTTMIADYLRDNPWLLHFGATTFLFGILASFWFRRKSAEKPKEKKASKKAK